MSGAHETTTAGPRTVPVLSSMAGVKSPECSRTPRPSDVLRAGTARAPVGASRCVPMSVPWRFPPVSIWDMTLYPGFETGGW